jgi:hypothetical protein
MCICDKVKDPEVSRFFCMIYVSLVSQESTQQGERKVRVRGDGTVRAEMGVRWP